MVTIRILIALLPTARLEILPPPDVRDSLAELRTMLSRREPATSRSSAGEAAAPTAGWQVYTTPAHPTITPDGAIWWVNVEATPQLMCGRADRFESFPLDIGGLPHENMWYLASDTRGRIWVFSNSEVSRVAFFDHGVWRSFRTLDNAFRIVAREEKGNPDFRIGDPRQVFYPAFAGDGRVAYRDLHSLAYFDGSWWNRPQTVVRRGRYAVYGGFGRTDGPPFYIDGVLTVRMGGQYHQLCGEQWQMAKQAIDCPYDEILPPSGNPRQQTAAELVRTFRGQTVHLQDNVGTTWTGSTTDLCRTLGGVTVQFPSARALLSSQDRIEEVFADAAGRTWFILPGNRWHCGTGSCSRLAVYDPKQDLPRIEWNDRPRDIVRAGSVVASVRVASASGALMASYQCDGASWRQAAVKNSCCEIPLAGWPNGVHVLRVQAHDRLLRPSTMLTHTFEVRRNHDREARMFVELLGSADFDEREIAAGALVQIGRPAVPALTGAKKAADSDQAWWIQAILDEIDRADAK